MPRTYLPQEVRSRLERANYLRRADKRAFIDKNIDVVLHAATINKYVRALTANRRSGCINFKYNGRRVQYWLGTLKLVVSNPISYTVYTDFSIQQFHRELGKNDPHDAFKLKETVDG